LNKTCGLVICSLLFLGESAFLLNASTQQYQNATVVGVQKYEPDTPRYGKRNDAPPTASEYDYNISIRLNCLVYVGRYQSAIDYLPGVFAPNHSVEISLQKHLMFVQVPGAGEVKMGIVRHYTLSGNSCVAGR
jgi:hypothetical protein